MDKTYSIYNLAGQRLASFPTIERAAQWLGMATYSVQDALYKKARIKRVYIMGVGDTDELPMSKVVQYRAQRDIHIITEDVQTGETVCAYINLRELQLDHGISYARAMEYIEDGRLLYNLVVRKCTYYEALYEVFYERKGISKYDSTLIKEVTTSEEIEEVSRASR